MKHSLRVMSFAMAISVTSAILPLATAQTQPATSTPPPPATQAQPPTTQAQPQKNTHDKAKGAAAGAAIGAATTGNAATGYRQSGFPGRPVGCHFSGTSPTDNYRWGRTPRRRCRTLVNW